MAHGRHEQRNGYGELLMGSAQVPVATLRKRETPSTLQRVTAVITLRDALVIVGYVALLRGVAMVFAPAAWIVGGALLLYAGWRMGKASH